MNAQKYTPGSRPLPLTAGRLSTSLLASRATAWASPPILVILAALAAVRGGQRVTTDSPEETYDVLAKYGQDLVELARNHKLDPVINRCSTET